MVEPLDLISLSQGKEEAVVEVDLGEAEVGLVVAEVGLVGIDEEAEEGLIEEAEAEAEDSLVGEGVAVLEAETTRLDLQTKVVLLSLKAQKLNLTDPIRVLPYAFLFPN